VKEGGKRRIMRDQWFSKEKGAVGRRMRVVFGTKTKINQEVQN